MNKFWSTIKAAYIKFRKTIGWYHVREIWVSSVPISEESEVHVANNLGCTQELYGGYEKLFNLQGKINWHDCWMERIKFIGKLGDWPTNPDTFEYAWCMSFHVNVLTKADDVPDQTFYLPRDLNLVLGDATELYHEEEGKIPDVCVIHYFEREEDARIDYHTHVQRLQDEARRLHDINHIFNGFN